MDPKNYGKLLKTSKKIGLGQIDSEWKRFIKFLDQTQPKTILEIGSNKGGSSYTLANFAEKLVCVDIIDRNRAKDKISKLCEFEFITGDSKDPSVVAKVSKIFSNGLDLLFIDGDHTYEGAKADYENYGKMIKSGGHIVFHDIVASTKHINKKCLVFKLWKEIKLENKDIVEYCAGEDWAGIGIVRVK